MKDSNAEACPIAVIGVGSPILDVLATVPEAFLEQVPGEKGGMELVDEDQMADLLKRLPETPVEVAGGSAANTVLTLARLGLPVSFLGQLGDDQRGRDYAANAARHGVDTARLKYGTGASAVCLSLVTPDGERTMRTCLGAAARLAPGSIHRADFEGCRHAHIEGYLLFNRELMDRVLHCAQEAGCTVSLDLASFEVVRAAGAQLPALLEAFVTLVFANEEEAEAYAGGDTAPEAVAGLLAQRCAVAAVKLGARGAVLASAAGAVEVAPVAVERIVDTTGAGDAWAAGFLAGWLQGRDLAASGALGSQLGAAAVQVVGAFLPEMALQAARNRLASV